MDQWTNIDSTAAIYAVGNLFRNDITIFVPRNDDHDAATCDSKMIIPFVKWIKHGIWVSGSFNKLCSKSIKLFLRNGGMCDCSECNETDVNDNDNNKMKEFNCVEMKKIYAFLNQSLLTIQNILSFAGNKIQILAPFTDHDMNTIINLYIESMNTIINFINVLKYSTYNCQYFKRYLSNGTRYRTLIHRLLKILVKVSKMCTEKQLSNKNGLVQINRRMIASKLLPKLQSVQQMPFFHRDLLLIALYLQQHDQGSDGFGIRCQLLSYIDNMVQMERSKFCNNEHNVCTLIFEGECQTAKIRYHCDNLMDFQNINDKRMSFVNFLFDKLNQRLIELIVKCASYNNETWPATCSALNCLQTIISIITQLEQDSNSKQRNFVYIRQLFDANQLNILPIVLKWINCDYDDEIDCWRTQFRKCAFQVTALRCLSNMIQYQINCLKQWTRSNDVIEYSYPGSNVSKNMPNSSRNQPREIEFIDCSVRKMMSVQLEVISQNLSNIKLGEDCFEFLANLRYDLKFYELIDATNGTPNSIVIRAIKSMNRQWTDESFTKLYHEYLDPDLKLGDFLNQFPWLFLCIIESAFCDNMTEKKWYKSWPMLELIDKCMYRNMDMKRENYENERIIDKIMAIAGKIKNNDLVAVEEPHEVYMPQTLTRLMGFIHVRDYNYYKDNTYLINKIVLTLKRMTVCWLPKLILLPTMHIKNGSNGARTIQNAVLYGAEHTIIQSLKGRLGAGNDCYNCNQYPIWHKIVKKGCYFELKNKCGHGNDHDYYLSQLWRMNGILNFYHLLQFDLNSNDIGLNNKINLKSTMYCFRQVLKYSENSFDKMECFKFLLLLHLLNQNNYAIKKYQMKISNNSKLSYLKDWIKQLQKRDQKSNDNVYHFMNKIINHDHYDNINRNDKFKHIENDFLIDLGKNASSMTAMVVNNESFANTICNTMTCKQCNWIKCNERNIKLRKCKKCKSVFYCSKQCQKNDWETHRQVCCVEKL